MPQHMKNHHSHINTEKLEMYVLSPAECSAVLGKLGKSAKVARKRKRGDKEDIDEVQEITNAGGGTEEERYLKRPQRGGAIIEGDSDDSGDSVYVDNDSQ
jgi:hypothetical protein